MTVNAGDTVIIGGLIAENAIENRKFVPVLSDLPFIGKIFQSTSIDKEQRELLIFITPNVVGYTYYAKKHTIYHHRIWNCCFSMHPLFS